MKLFSKLSLLIGVFLGSFMMAQAATILFPSGGGTGWGALQSNTILLGNGINRISTTTAGTNGFTLGLVSGVPTWVATSTNSCSGSISCSYASGTWTFTVSASGGGSGNVATSTNETKGGLPYYTSTSGTPALIGQVATSTLSSGTGLTTTGTAGAIVGGSSYTFKLADTVVTPGSYTNSNITVDQQGRLTAASNGAASGAGAIATSSSETKGQLSYWTSTSGTPALLGGVATSSLGIGSEFSYSGTLGALVGGANGSLTLTANGIALSKLATIGANTVLVNNTSSTGNVTSIATSSFFGTGTGGQVLTWNNGTPQWVATTTYSSPLSFASGAVSIGNAAADGSTKGAASFTANDFDASSGNISIDYTNGQAAGSGAKGFLTSTDWTTFNNKVATSRALTIAGTANQITSSAGAQDLSADRTWTLSIPSQFNISHASTTQLSTGLFYAGLTATTSIAGNGALTIGNITGSTQCLHVDTNGLVSGSGSDCGAGGGGSPGGTGTEVQFRSGATTFGALTPSAYTLASNRLSFGTTTQQLGVLTVGSSTEPQIVLSDNTAGDVNWFERAIAGNFYFGTSTTATSSNPLLSVISGTAGKNATTTFKSTDTTFQQTSGTAFNINDGFGTNLFQVNSASTTGNIFQINATSSAFSLFSDDQYGHLTASSTFTPSVSTCGTSPALEANANDSVGTIDAGTGSPTACTLTFGRPYSSTPVVVISDNSTTVTADVSAVSTTAFTISLSAGLSSVHLSYIVVMP